MKQSVKKSIFMSSLLLAGTLKVLFTLAALAMLGSLAVTVHAQTPAVRLLVIDSGNNRVLRYDGTTGAFIDEFIPAGSGGLATPENIQIGPDGHLYVSSWSTGSVKRYDKTTGAFLGDFIPPGSGGLANPDQLAFGSDGNLYVSDRFSGRVLRYNGVTGESLGTFVADGRLFGFIAFTFGPDEHLYASMFNPADGLPQCILRYNGKTGAFMDVFACPADSSSAFSGVAFGPDGHLYAGRYHLGEVWRLDGGSGQFLGALHCPGDTRADYLTFGPDGKLYVSNLDGNNVSRFNVQTDQCLGAFLVGGALNGGSTGLVVTSAFEEEPDSDGDGVPDNADDCPNSDLSATVVIDGCKSGVTNTLFPSGCTISDLIAECAGGASNHGQFVSCVSHVTNDLQKAGTLSGQQKGAIQSCAAQADIH